MRIAICDDEQAECLHLEKLVNEYDQSIDVTLFTTAESLLAGMHSQHCECVLLDIEMEGMNGFEAAKAISSLNDPPLVIFVTVSDEYTSRGYGVAFRYLKKPVNYIMLAEALSEAIAKVSSQKFTMLSGGVTHIVPEKDILFLEAVSRTLIVHTTENDYECHMKLSEAESALSGHSFACPHKGYLVNLQHVEAVGKNELSLAGGARLPLSRRRKQEFESALVHYIRR